MNPLSLPDMAKKGVLDTIDPSAFSQYSERYGLKRPQETENPFRILYVEVQRYYLAVHGTMGPICPFREGNIMLTAMFLSACKGNASPNPPRSWGHFATVTWIYALLNLVDELSSAVRKIRIQRHIDRWIRHYNCT